MKKFLLAICLAVSAQAHAQFDRGVQNRPYTDLRPMHFGIMVGTHWQDLELVNAGPQTVTYADGTSEQTLVAADVDRWDMGFTVGVLAETRLSENFQLRIAPAMLFGNRHITYRDFTHTDDHGAPTVQHQYMKTVYFSTACDLIFAAPRVVNHRPYLLAGITPMLNMSNKSSEYLKLNKMDVFAEVGIGLDKYLPYFKVRPELKFMFGLTNSLDKRHASQLRDTGMLPYTQAVSKAHSKVIALTLYFE